MQNCDLKGIYNKTARVSNGRVLYQQHDPISSKPGANFLYYDEKNYCIGINPDLDCEEQQILAEKPDDSKICPQMVEKWSKANATVTCEFIHKGLTNPKILEKILTDPVKVFLVRFFNGGSRSIETHQMWNDLGQASTLKNSLFCLKNIMYK